MSKFWKIVMWILIILVAAGIAGVFWAKSVWDKITFGMPRLIALNLNGLTAADLQTMLVSGGSREVIATIGMDVTNKNNFSIPFSSLKVKLIYNGQVIAESSDMLKGNNKVPENGVLSVVDDVKITLNTSGLQMLIDKAVKGKTSVDLKTSVKVFGIPLPKKFDTVTFEF